MRNNRDKKFCYCNVAIYADLAARTQLINQAIDCDPFQTAILTPQ